MLVVVFTPIAGLLLVVPLIVFLVTKFKQRNATSDTKDVTEEKPLNRIFKEETNDVPEETPLNRVFKEETSPGANSDFTRAVKSDMSSKKRADANDDVSPARTTLANDPNHGDQTYKKTSHVNCRLNEQ